MKNFFYASIAFFVLADLALAMIPDSLRKLATVKDKNSEAYMFLAQEAAMDTKYAAERMLDGENSAGALKILEVAVHLMPHRTDITHLRKKSLETYLKITKKLEEKSEKNCSLLQERYQFLKSIAPDSLAQLKLETSCAPLAKISLPATDEDLLSIPEPKVLKNLEEEFKTNLVKTFPWDDVLANSFLLLRSLYGEEFRLVCKNFNGDLSECDSDKRDETHFRSASHQYCGYLEGLLSVSHGKKPLLCVYDKRNVFKTTPELYEIYEKALDNLAFEEDIPTHLVMNMTLKYLDRSEGKEILVVSSPRAYIEAGAVKLEPYNASFALKPEEKKDLKEVTFSINYKKTFDVYRRNFKSSLSASLPQLLKADKK